MVAASVEWFEGQFEPAETAVESSLIAKLREAHTNVFGQPPTICGVSYGSDLRFFTNDAKIPAVLYGPGDVALAHTVDEHIAMDEVIQVAKVLALTISNWWNHS